MDNPLKIVLYDRVFKRLGAIGAPIEVTMAVRRNALSTMDVTVAGDDPMREWLDDDTVRVTVEYLGELLFSGRLSGAQGGFTGHAPVVYSFASWWSWMAGTLAWVVPTNPINPTVFQAGTSPAYTAQSIYPPGAVVGPVGDVSGQTGHYYWPDGSAVSGGFTVRYAEQAIKLVCLQNFAHMNRPVVVQGLNPNNIAGTIGGLNRGGDALAAHQLPDMRFGALETELGDLIDWSGLTVTLEHDGVTPAVVLDVKEPVEFPIPITAGSGIIRDGSWSRTVPTATDEVVGGPGEDAARAFWRLQADDLIAAGYDRMEVFRDATGATLQWPEELDEALQVAKYYLLRSDISQANKNAFQSYLTTEGRKALTAGRPTSGLGVKLNEQEWFHFWGEDGIHLGDRITIRTDMGVEFSDVITGADIALNSSGFVVTPIAGEYSNDPTEQVAAAIRALRLSQHRISAQK